MLSVTASWVWLWPSLSPTVSTGSHPTGGSSLQRGAFTDCKLALTLAFTASNWLNCHGHLHILFHNACLLPIRSHDTLLLIYTGASLIDGSVKGQYVTFGCFFFNLLMRASLMTDTWKYLTSNLLVVQLAPTWSMLGSMTMALTTHLDDRLICRKKFGSTLMTLGS